MKTYEMKMEALLNAKESANILAENIRAIETQLSLYGAILDDRVQENLVNRLAFLKQEYTKSVSLAMHYQKELGM